MSSFGHSAFGERPLGASSDLVFDYTQKVFAFNIQETETISPVLNVALGPRPVAITGTFTNFTSVLDGGAYDWVNTNNAQSLNNVRTSCGGTGETWGGATILKTALLRSSGAATWGTTPEGAFTGFNIVVDGYFNTAAGVLPNKRISEIGAFRNSDSTRYVITPNNTVDGATDFLNTIPWTGPTFTLDDINSPNFYVDVRFEGDASGSSGSGGGRGAFIDYLGVEKVILQLAATDKRFSFNVQESIQYNVNLIEIDPPGEKRFEFSVVNSIQQNYNVFVDHPVFVSMSTGWLTPGNASGWVNSNNVKVEDGAYATGTVTGWVSDTPPNLQISNFGINLPSNAQVTSFSTEFKAYWDAGPGITGNYDKSGLGFFKNVASGGSVFSTNIPLVEITQTPSVKSSVVTSEFLTGMSIADWNNPTAGFRFSALGTSDNAFDGGTVNTHFDYLKIKIDYLGPAKSVPFAIQESLTYTATLDTVRTPKLLTFALIENSSFMFPSIKRSRTNALNLVENIAYNFALDVELGVTLFSFNVNETITYATALARHKKIDLSLNEIETIAVAAVRRARASSFNIVENETFEFNNTRNRGTSFNVNEVSSYEAYLKRNRLNAFDLAETIAYTFDLESQVTKFFTMNIDEVQSVVINFANTRGFSLTIEELETLSINTLARARVRALEMAINELQTLSANLKLNKSFAVNVAETQLIHIHTLNRIKQLSVALAEQLSIMPALARTKLVNLDIEEYLSIDFLISKSKQFAAQINQQVEYVTEVIRSRKVLAEINEVEEINGALNALKLISAAIDEVEEINVNLNRLMFNSFAIEQLEAFNFNLGQLKQFASSIEEAITISSEIVRRRSVNTEIEESLQYNGTVNRLVKSSMNIVESSGVNISIDRLRNVITEIIESETIDFKFARIREVIAEINESYSINVSISIFAVDPFSLNITIAFEKFVQLPDGTLSLQEFTDSWTIFKNAETINIDLPVGETIVLNIENQM